MKYKSEVPRKEQIAMSRFPLLPGDRVLIRHEGSFHNGRVIEVGYANPEYALGGPMAENSAVICWKKNDREECEEFFRDRGRRQTRIRLRKSVWAMISISVYKGMSGYLATWGESQKKLYAYDIARLMQRGWLNKIDP